MLTSLKVSGCTSLTKLNCSINYVDSLDLSGCTSLTELNTSRNQLTSLDLSDQKGLTKLNCSDNLLREIDLSGCPRIDSLICDINQIKERGMTKLVNSLPDLQGKGVGLFRVFNETSEREGNVCLSDHVATAKAKGWKTQFRRDRYRDIWYDYIGADKPTFVVTEESTRGGIVTITGANNLNTVAYGTELTIEATPADGYKLTALTANDEDILATMKVVVTNNVTIKATFEDHTGVERAVTQLVQLYPNPATDYVIVEGVAPASEVTLHSMTGERLYAGRADSRGSLQIDLTPYADGVYLVCIAGEIYRVVVRK